MTSQLYCSLFFLIREFFNARIGNERMCSNGDAVDANQRGID